jgi:hypothetical protein
VASPAWRARLITVSETIGVILAATALVSACTGQPQRPAARPSRREVVRVHPVAGTLGTVGSYRVGKRRLTFLEPAHVGPAGQPLGQRTLVTLVRYPLARTPVAPQPASGSFPLLMFAPGFMQCAGPSRSGVPRQSMISSRWVLQIIPAWSRGVNFRAVTSSPIDQLRERRDVRQRVWSESRRRNR